MLREALLRHLNIHFSAMLLQTEIGVLLEPPGQDLTFADAAEQWRWWRMLPRIIQAHLSQAREIASKHLGSGT
jgi:hypothetical protein